MSKSIPAPISSQLINTFSRRPKQKSETHSYSTLLKKSKKAFAFDFLIWVEWLCVFNLCLGSREKVGVHWEPTGARVDFGMNNSMENYLSNALKNELTQTI